MNLEVGKQSTSPTTPLYLTSHTNKSHTPLTKSNHVLSWAMALTPEKKVKDRAVKLLKAQGLYYFFPATHGFGRSGVPDIICCINGRFLGIECKAGTNQPTALQEKEMQSIRDAGGRTIVVNENNLTMLGELIEEILNEQRRTDIT